MDPLTAFALAIKAVAEMITEIVKGQPEEFRRKAWERWERQTDAWEKLFNPQPPKETTKH